MRKLIAIWAAKASSVVGRLMGKKSSSSPGVIALKICPNLIKILSKNISKGVIVTCGTNGKTTTNNLLCAALEAKGYRVLCNRLGANMLGGVATAFAQACGIFGGFKADYACLEVDEASTLKVFDHIKPDVMIITNLFRDQLDRYGEIDITTDILRRAIKKAPNLKLVLNGDDPLCAQFGIDADALYYGISEPTLPQTDDAKEGRFCPVCGAEQKFNYYHYSQLGDYYCPSCSFRRPEIDFEVKNVSLGSPMRFTINGEPMELNYKGFYNIYNMAAVYAGMSALGEKTDDFGSLLGSYKPQIGRMEEIDLGKPVILNLAKNPAGFNQAIATVTADKRRKDVIIAIIDNANDGRDVSWLWDVDFDKVSDENLNTLTVTGIRVYDISLRFKYAGVKVDFETTDMRAAIERALSTNSEAVYVLVNYTALYSTETVMLGIKKSLGK